MALARVVQARTGASGQRAGPVRGRMLRECGAFLACDIRVPGSADPGHAASRARLRAARARSSASILARHKRPLARSRGPSSWAGDRAFATDLSATCAGTGSRRRVAKGVRQLVLTPRSWRIPEVERSEGLRPEVQAGGARHLVTACFRRSGSEVPDTTLPDAQAAPLEVPDTSLSDAQAAPLEVVPDTSLPDAQAAPLEVPDTSLPDAQAARSRCQTPRYRMLRRSGSRCPLEVPDTSLPDAQAVPARGARHLVIGCSGGPARGAARGARHLVTGCSGGPA